MSCSKNDFFREENFHANFTSYHYQADLLMLFLWRGYKNGYMFQLETESKDAEKFDDLVFSYLHERKTFATYLQAKYSTKEKHTWKYQDFATDRNSTIGNLKKYFTSFRKIKQKFCDEVAENFFLCSNRVFDCLKLKDYNNDNDNVLEFEEIKTDIEHMENGKSIKKDIFHGFQDNNLWKMYRIKIFSSQVYEKLQNVRNLSILAEELANCIIDIRKTTVTNIVELDMENFWFSKYHKALVNENVIEMYQEVMTFSSWFTSDKRIKADKIIILDDKGMEFDLLTFRKMFKEEYKNMISMPMENVVFNTELLQYFCDNLKSKSKILEISSKEMLNKLVTSLVKLATEEIVEIDDIITEHFEIIKKVLTKTNRCGFTQNFINAEKISEKAAEFRELLQNQLEQNGMNKLDFKTLLYSKEIIFKFNVKKLDKMVEAIKNILTNNEITNSLNENLCVETMNLIKSLNGFVFEKEGSCVIKFRDSFITDYDTVADIRLLKSKLKKELNADNIFSLKNLKFRISNYPSCSTSFNENENIEDEIKDFCKNFYIVTSPCETMLADCVKNELGEKYSFWKANYTKDKLMLKIIEFAKGNEGRHLTYRDTEQFLDDCVTQTMVHEVSILTTQYCNFLKSYNIFYDYQKYADLMAIVSQRDLNKMVNQVLHVMTEEPLLTAMKVEQSIRQIIDLQNKFILCPLSLLLNSQILAIAAFESKYINILIIVEDVDNFDEVFCEKIFSIIREYKEKQMVMITNHTSMLAKHLNQLFEKDDATAGGQKVFPICYNEKYDGQFFEHLSEESQKDLLFKEVNFNNKNITLKNLISDNSWYHAINGKTLLQMFIEKDPKILPNLIPFQESGHEYYIKRNINIVEFNNELFNETMQLENHCFAIEGESEIDVRNFLKGKNVKLENICTANEFFKQKNNPYFIIISSSEANLEFKNLCSHDIFIHWLKIHDKKLFWYYSYAPSKLQNELNNPLSSVLKFCIKTTNIKENDFFKYTGDSQTNIICDFAGMGKSTILNSFVERNVNLQIWIVRINLNEYTRLLSNLVHQTSDKCDFNFFDKKPQNYAELILQMFGSCISNKFDVQNKLMNDNDISFKDFLQKHYIITSNMILENYVFLYFFYCGKVKILFDGFDEINPTYADQVLSVINKIKHETKNQIWVTSRPHCKDILEKKLKTFAYTLVPFSKKDQVEYLTNIWKKEWDGNVTFFTVKNINNYASTLISSFSKFVGIESNKFMGIPLKMKMMAEIFMKNDEINSDNNSKWLGCFDYLAEKNNRKKVILAGKQKENDLHFSNQNLNLFFLYNTFVTKKINRFYSIMYGTNDTNSYRCNLRDIFFYQQNEVHKLLGFLQLTNKHKDVLEAEIKHFMTKKNTDLTNKWIKNFQDGTENLGIVSKVLFNGQPIFDHSTYAEYFCASFLMEQLVNRPESNKHVFKILNKILENEVPLFEFCIKHLIEHEIGIDELTRIILEKVTPALFSMRYKFQKCAEFFIIDNKFGLNFNVSDIFGKTILHYAAESQNDRLIWKILFPWPTFTQKNFYSSSSLLNFIEAKDYENKKAIDYASKDENVFMLLSAAENMLENIVLYENNRTNFDKTSHEKNNKFSDFKEILQHDSFDKIMHSFTTLPHSLFLEYNKISGKFFDVFFKRSDLQFKQKQKIFFMIFISQYIKITKECLTETEMVCDHLQQEYLGNRKWRVLYERFCLQHKICELLLMICWMENAIKSRSTVTTGIL